MCIALSKDLEAYLKRQFARYDSGVLTDDQLDTAIDAAEKAERAKRRGHAWGVPPEPISETLPDDPPVPPPPAPMPIPETVPEPPPILPPVDEPVERREKVLVLA